MKKFYMSLAALAVFVSGILLINIFGGTSNATLPRDCDNNSIIYCGGITSSELATRYNENKTGDLKTIYHSYGLTDTEMTHASTYSKMGEVHKDGRVTVNGQTVATGATSIGRQKIFSHTTAVNIGGKTYYDTTPQYSFVPESIVAYVFFDANGNFKAAVLTSCGNPVKAKPPVYKCDSLTQNKISRTEYSFSAAASASNGASIVSYTYDFGDGQKVTSSATKVSHTYAKEGTYVAKLSVTIKVAGANKTVTAPACQTTVTVTPPPVTPVYTCDSLTQTQISRTEYSFDGAATAEGGAIIESYTFDFGDGSTATVATPTGVKHDYQKEGTYNAKLSVTVKVNGQEKTVADATKCVAQVTVTPPNECKPGVPTGSPECTPCEIPGKEQYPKNSPLCVETPTELPHTGPAGFVGGALGIGSLVAAGGYYFASRRGLLAELLKR